MFVKSFVTPFDSALHVLRLVPLASRLLSARSRLNWVGPFAACVVPAHFVVVPSAERATAVQVHARRSLAGARVCAVNETRRAGRMAAHAALRMAYAGSPLTPTATPFWR
ncbi:hypothetical protein [Paraburkholderia kirstenboschensis]|uniref:hypothetical protein n=1 Tax=Paraburkholderia kirstenboschensis TaxID=1245436 RepID=UPI000AEF27CE|nr:hypothetical protein [Paraburkholderia kirstenboschensis]